jgi:hypothetical protein
LVEKHAKKTDEELSDFFLQLFLQGDVPAETRQRISEYAKNAHKQKLPAFWSEQDKAEQRIISICHLVMTLPEYQLD